MVADLVIFEKENDTQNIIKNYLEDYPEIRTDNIFDDYAAGLRYVKENKPKIILFSMTKDSTACFKIIQKLAEYKTNVIVLSEDFTTSNIIKVLRHGAKDFVSKPIIKKDLQTAISKCVQDDVKVLNKSQIISVFSNKGGIGKTAIAVNLAMELTKLTREKVLLMDLNLPVGDIPTFLDIKPTVSISDVINNSQNDNQNYIKDICCRYKTTDLYILAEPLNIRQPYTITPKQITQLFNYLKNYFSYIIVDMGSAVDKFNLSILDNADMILLTTIINLPLIRNCQRCIDLFQTLNYPENKVKILVNRYLENDEITVNDVEKTLNKTVYWKIPNNYYTVMSSINKGITLSEVNENSNITESFTGLAVKILEDMFEKDIK